MKDSILLCPCLSWGKKLIPIYAELTSTLAKAKKCLEEFCFVLFFTLMHARFLC